MLCNLLSITEIIILLKVKVRGIRIELEEVERAIALVCKCSLNKIVILCNSNIQNNDQLKVSGGSNLILFFEEEILQSIPFIDDCNSTDSNKKTSNSVNDFRKFLIDKLLPIHMPTFILPVGQFPKTTTGKVDKNKLLERFEQQFSVVENNERHNSIVEKDPHSYSHGTPFNTITCEDLTGASLLSKKEIVDLLASKDTVTLCNTILSIYCQSLSRKVNDCIIRINHKQSNDTNVNITNFDRVDNIFQEINFYALGGNSLLAVEVLWRLRQLFPYNFFLDDLKLSILNLVGKVIDYTEYFERNSGASSHNTIKRKLMNRNLAQEDMISKRICTEQKLKVDICCNEWIGRAGTSNLHFSTEYNTYKAVDRNFLSSISMNEKWAHNLMRCIDASPVILFKSNENVHQAKTIDTKGISRGLIFIGSHGGDFVALDMISGEVVWRVLLGGEHIEGSAVCNQDGSKVFVCSYRGSDVDGRVPQNEEPSQNEYTEDCPKDDFQSLGTVWAIDTRSGNILWRFRTLGEIKSMPVTVIDDQRAEVLIAGAYDGQVYFINADNGISLLSVKLDGSIFTSPTIIDHKLADTKRLLVITTTKGKVTLLSYSLHNLSANGNTEKLSVSVEVFSTYDTGNFPIFSTPLYDIRTNSILFGVTDGSVRCLGLKRLDFEKDRGIYSDDGNCSTATRNRYEWYEKWTIRNTDKPIFSSPCKNNYTNSDSIIIGSHAGIVKCISIDTGDVLWKAANSTTVFSAPFCTSIKFIEGGELVAIPVVIVTTTAGDIIALDALDGKIICKKKIPGEIYSSPICIENRVYFGGRDDKLHCYNFKIDKQ